MNYNLTQSNKQTSNDAQSSTLAEQTQYSAGVITYLSSSLLHCSGLDSVAIGVMIYVQEDLPCIVCDIQENLVIAALMFDLSQYQINVGDPVWTYGAQCSVLANQDLLSYKVVDTLGKPISSLYSSCIPQKQNKDYEHYNIYSPAPNIIDRLPVNRPLYTGKYVLDTLIPIGKGQRQLIIGDGRLGLSRVATDVIRRQKDEPNTVCIYTCIGKTDSYIKKIIQQLEDLDNALVIASSVKILGSQLIATNAGCSIAEFYRDQGKDVLIVYDDLSKHAFYYRHLHLLLKRNPGREAYPSSIFYNHANLLERAGEFNTLSLKSQKSVNISHASITALPIVDTYGPEMINYISTNIISITDGQWYINSEQFNKGFNPPIDINLSVSRIGGNAQLGPIRKLASNTKIVLATQRELIDFESFSDVGQYVKDAIKNYKIITSLFKQDYGQLSSISDTLVMLLVAKHRLFNEFDVEEVHLILKGLTNHLSQYDSYADLINDCVDKEQLEGWLIKIKYYLDTLTVNT